MRLELISIDKTLLAEVTLEWLFSAMDSRLVRLKMALETSKILLFILAILLVFIDVPGV